MAISSPAADLLALKTALQGIEPVAFERLCAALAGRMIGVGIAIAKSGFQYGGDGGTAGRQGRRLRIETKRYADTNPLSERELLGELEQASQRDAALELWVLFATREANEQLETSLFKSGLKHGVPVLVVDWKKDSFPVLAALCASAPDVVTDLAGVSAGDCARRIAPFAASAIAQLNRDLSDWHPGILPVEKISREWLTRLWTSAPDAVAAFGQDAAGGADPAFIERRSVVAELDAWRAESTQSPAMVVGEEGMGKTWATLGWFFTNADRLSIPLIIPSGAMPAGSRMTTVDVKALLASRLHEVTGVRDEAFWTARIDKMLARPETEGPVFVLMLDGMNQAPDAAWLPLHQQLQSGPFAGRVRILSTTRPLFLETQLRNMSALIFAPRKIDIGPYDTAVGGEFDTMLATRGVGRYEIRDELVPLASVPRLFDLVLRLRDRLHGLKRITVHGLLWEYGRDSLGVRGGRAFSESEWQEWLATIAEQLRSTGSARFTRGEVERITARPTLNASEVFARLSDIVDSPLSDRDGIGRIVLRPETVAHALGAAILSHLADGERTAEEAAAELETWLGPISGLSERGEILRAAVAILCASPDAIPLVVGDAIVAAWLSTQNLPDNHQEDVMALAATIARPLLFAVETITSTALSAARDLAIEGLRSIPRADDGVRALVREATTRWMRTISRDVEEGSRKSEDGEKARAKRMVDRIGSDTDGKRTLFGLEVEFVSSSDGAAFAQAPALLEGYPLAGFIDLLELAALQLAVRNRLDAWASLKWLALWNQIDFAETAVELQKRAEDVLTRAVEPGVEPLLASRVSALLLWMSANPEVEQRAQNLDPRLDSWRSYEDYDADPVSSMFMLERRHAEQALNDPRLAPLARARRLQHFWWDPALVVSDQAATEMAAAAQAFESKRFGGGPYQTAEDLDLEQLAPALARCSPGALARLTRCRIAALASMAESPPVLGDAVYDALLIGDTATAALMRTARANIDNGSVTEVDEGNRQLLLQTELIELSGENQVEAILGARLPKLFTNMNRLVERHRGDPAEVTERLVLLLSIAAVGLGPIAAEWLEQFALTASEETQSAAFEALLHCRAAEFGGKLWATGWMWQPGRELASHYGSLALIAGTLNVPFELLAPRIAPWLIAKAAHNRGKAPTEVRLAAEILDRVVRRPAADAPDPGSQITVDLTARTDDPFSMSLTPGEASGGDSPLEQLNVRMNQDARDEAAKRAVAIAVDRIRSARQGGSSLYLANLEPHDLAPFLDHASSIVDVWLEGLETESPDFKRRVRLAEGFFIALTEALLQNDLDRGVALWIGVKASLHTKFVGTAGIDKMVLMLLRAPANDQVDSLVRDLIEPRLAHSDDILLDIAVAAAAAQRGELLGTLAAEDRASGIRWRAERAKALDAFSPGEGASPHFPDGRDTVTDINEARWGERRYRDHAARHWWSEYWRAPDGESAFAAWTVLHTCVDRRAIEWIMREWPSRDADFPLMDRKRPFAARRLTDLKRAAETTDKKMDRKLFGRDIVNDIRPWSRRGDFDNGPSTAT
jgi:hypothetical protein